jgi:hypothetical protein
MDLAQMNRAYLPQWLNYGLWFMAEAAIVCTDIGQVRCMFFELREFTIHLHIGHWNCYCNKYPHSQDPINCWLCFGYCGYSFHTALLSARWITEGPSSLRALYLGICGWRLHLLLYRAFSHHRHDSSSCDGWLPSLKGSLCIRRVSLHFQS